MKILTVSSKRLFDKCPRAWSYRNVLKLESKEISASIIRGNEFHEGAEGTYGEDAEKISTSKQTAYDRWAKSYDDVKAHIVEVPLVVPLNKLREYCNLTPLAHYEGWYYGGVADVIGRTYDTKLWLLDHKTVQRFYPMSSLFSLEQIGMYCVACECAGLCIPDGGIISRVKQLEGVHGDHILNYTLKALSRDGIDLGKTHVRDLIKQIEQRKTNTSTSTNTSTKLDTHTRLDTQDTQSSLTRVRVTDKSIRISVTQHSAEGYLTESIRDIRGSLVHVQRHYYPLSRVHREQIVRDFLSFADEVIEPREGLDRRTPGLHCSQCSYNLACATERGLGLKIGEAVDPEAFRVAEPNQEILQRLRKIEPRSCK